MVGYQKYQKNQVEGSGPLGLVLLSYESLYKSLMRARIAIEAGDYAEEANHTARALEAIIELSTSLNFEDGKDVAINLANLYKYMTDQLAGNMCSGNTSQVSEVMNLVQTLREGWQQLSLNQESDAVKTASLPARKSSPVASMSYAYSR